MSNYNQHSFDLQTVVDGYVSGSGGYLSGALTNIYKNFSIQMVATASSAGVGTLDLEGSHDGVNWASLTNNTPLAISGNGCYIVNFDSVCVPFKRVKVSRTSGGLGALTVTICSMV